jgi:2-keto-4-pentenoate hydratase
MEPRLVSALAEQMEHRREALARGARHVGWKLGMGDRESIGGRIAVGYLTSETVLDTNGRYRADRGAQLHADAEIAVEMGGDVDPAADATAVEQAIARYGAAVEIVDLAALAGEPDSVVAADVFHRAVAFGELQPAPLAEVEVELSVNGEMRAAARSLDDLPDRIAKAARLLEAVGERLRAGDRVITGSVVQERIRVSDAVVADFGRLGRVCVQIVP